MPEDANMFLREPYAHLKFACGPGIVDLVVANIVAYQEVILLPTF